MKTVFRAWDDYFEAGRFVYGDNRCETEFEFEWIIKGDKISCYPIDFMKETEYNGIFYENLYAAIMTHPLEVTQSTGFYDKNGVEIFLGDIVEDSNGKESEIIFNNGSILAKRGELLFSFNSEIAKSVKVISSIFERGNYK